MLRQYLNTRFPRSFIIKKPFTGVLIIATFSFLFLILYKPLGVKGARTFSLELTMAVYSLFSGISAFLAIILLKSIKWFREEKEWTILKELLASLIVILATCLSVYFLGFIVEEPLPRWNLTTFFDSVSHAFLIGIIPFAFFIFVNYRYLFPHKIESLSVSGENVSDAMAEQKLIRISSQLKKESLSFYPSELIYAESDGNYVNFYLDKGSQVKKEVIRNSINNIEQQLSSIPFLFRTHRAFIVNLRKVLSKHGTTLGYNLKLSGTETKIPVSRNNTKQFNLALSSLSER
ncbi:MAG TPA: LytTR family DNA-binding domain-containing protein [Bacteroidales bacterium]|jgi:hypothetical protein|nr:LytTR family DNA-binding domain-containing protein [Bacteroidales bacterium]